MFSVWTLRKLSTHISLWTIEQTMIYTQSGKSLINVTNSNGPIPIGISERTGNIFEYL